MQTTRLRQALATLTAAAVLATMTVATVAAPASAAKPKCQGKTATIVGTRKGERIVGTARRDVIVAKGGADRIFGRGGNDLICAGTGNDLVVGGPGADTLWGQLGNDRLHGGPGNDFLAGQVGNDTLNGGLNFDTCFQGTGVGLVTNCELPAPPPPPPPPPPPTLVVAYADANKNHLYDAGDVLIAEIVDTNGSGIVDPGDTINTNEYPTTPLAVAPAAIRKTMEPWGVKSHTVNSLDLNAANLDIVAVNSTVAGQVFVWVRSSAATSGDIYQEVGPGTSLALDNKLAGNDLDVVVYAFNSPSQPISQFTLAGDSQGDDGFVDVDFAPGI